MVSEPSRRAFAAVVAHLAAFPGSPAESALIDIPNLTPKEIGQALAMAESLAIELGKVLEGAPAVLSWVDMPAALTWADLAAD